MGTRSTYRVINQFTHPKTKKLVNDKLVLVYLQYDGYPDGHPLDTAEWLANGKLVNGLSYNDGKNVFNGAGCLAAQLIERLKNGPGGTYIHPLSHRGKSWEDYTYDVIIKEDKTIEIVVYSVGGMDKPRFKKLFAGTPEEYIAQYSKEPA